MDFLVSALTFLFYSTAASLGVSTYNIYTGKYLKKPLGPLRMLGYLTPGPNLYFLASHSLESLKTIGGNRLPLLKTKKRTSLETLERIQHLYLNPYLKGQKVDPFDRLKKEMKEDLAFIFEQAKIGLTPFSPKRKSLSSKYFFTTVLPGDIQELKTHPSDPYYLWLLQSHEESFDTILESFEKSIQLHGKIEQKVADMSQELLSVFSSSLQQHKNELILQEQEQKNIATQDLHQNLSFELKYQKDILPELKEPEKLKEIVLSIHSKKGFENQEK